MAHITPPPPLAKYGFALNKHNHMFQDGIFLRYNFALKLVARTCVCGELYTVNQCMQTCKKGGYVILRHNSLRDLFAEILEEVCQLSFRRSRQRVCTHDATYCGFMPRP